jgi:hypothetical protein
MKVNVRELLTGFVSHVAASTEDARAQDHRQRSTASDVRMPRNHSDTTIPSRDRIRREEPAWLPVKRAGRSGTWNQPSSGLS